MIQNIQLAKSSKGGYSADSISAADKHAVHKYRQLFTYDELGNILTQQHTTPDKKLDWTRSYIYAEQTNYLLKHDKDQTLNDYEYDAHGNMTKMPHLQSMIWTVNDELQQVTLNASGDTAYYVYDTEGNRARKVIERGNVKEERFYLGDYEIYRTFTNETLNLERSTVHIMDDRDRIAMIDRETGGDTVIRYQLADHLGSSTIELDDKANIISYEEYHPFGTTSYQKHNTTISQKRYKYNGKERDNETGMCYYGARYYAAWICRFVSVDPLQFKYPNYTPFLYAGNNPVSKIDIDGLEEGKPKTHPNVIIFISKREKTLKDIDDQAKELKNWTVITGKDIKSVSKELKKKYEGKNINNLVIRTHGSENRGAIKYNPVNGNEFTTREIHKYYKKTVTDFSRGFMNSLNDVISKVKDGGNVVFIACAAGKDENFVKTAYGFFTNKNVNIYYNNTLSSFKGRVYDVFRNFKGYKMKFGKPITRPDMPNKGWKKVLPLLPSYRIKSMNKDGTISFELKYPEPIISRSKKIIINDKKRETSCNKTLRYA